MRSIVNRFLSLILCMCMIVPVLPNAALPVYAATSGTVTGLSDGNIGLSYSGDADGAWTASGTTITGSVTSTAGTCDDKDYNSTLVITNQKVTAATLSFDYSVALNSGTIQVGGKSVTAGGTYSGEIAAGESIKVYIKSGSTTATKISITNITLVSDVTATTTFEPAVNGSYTVNGNTITEPYSSSQSALNAYQLVATPAEGYQFLGWYNVTAGKYVGTDATLSLKVEENCTITAKFSAAENALFETGGQVYDDLNEAVSYAKTNSLSKITVISDGTISGNYTIPSGITLLIPNDSSNTLYTDTPVASEGDKGTRKAYRTLTMAEGASLTVEGGLSISGWYKSAAGSATGYMTGAYGLIRMSDSSTITVKNGGTIYAWGFVSGTGSVAVESGGTAMEWYQITDFRGGSASGSMRNNVFPISQYYIQNIEVPMTLYAGAKETAYTGVYAMSKNNTSAIPLIGDNGLFKIISGSLTKEYDGSVDRQKYTINGESSLNTLTLKLAGSSVNSAGYVLPITNNFSIDITSGSKFTVNQTTALLPGVEVNIAKDAEMNVASGVSLYVYDYSEWGGYVGGYNSEYIGVSYAPSKTGNRAALTDVKIDVNGTLTAAGSIYTTASGANICSSEGTGKYVQQSAVGTQTKTYQYTQSNSSVTAHEIAITPAQLKNADSTYVATKDIVADTTVHYSNGKWSTAQRVTVTFDANGGEGTMEAQQVTASADTALTANNGSITRTGYTFTGWNTAKDGTGTSYADGADINISADTTLYAQWEANTYTVTWVNDDGTELKKDENVEYGSKPSYDGAVPVKEADDQYTYTFAGWDPAITDETTVTADVTYKATYQKTLNSYTITWVNENGTILETDEHVEYGKIPSYDGAAPTKTGDAQYSYTFTGWSPEVSEVTGDATYTARFNESTNSYTVTWVNWDDTVLETDENVPYGTTPTYDGATPTREADDQYTYTFDSWTPTVDVVKGTITYKAVYTSTVNQYTITWMNGDDVIKTDQVAYGETPVYSGETPTKENTEQYTYTFSGWTPEITAVIGAATYTAVFRKTENTYTVTFADKAGIASAQAQSAVVGKSIILPDVTQARDGYTFAGWTESEEGTGEVLKAGEEYTPKANTTLYAKWEIKYIEVTFDANGGTGEAYTRRVQENTNTALTANTFTRADYTFTGWNTAADGSGTAYADSAVVNLKEKTTMYAQWKHNDGWFTDAEGSRTYYVNGELQKTGWTTIGSSIYYLDPETGYAAIEGIYWLPRQEGDGGDAWDAAHDSTGYTAQGYDQNCYYIFDADGVFQSDLNGLYKTGAEIKVSWRPELVEKNKVPALTERFVYVVNGQLPRHPGLVEAEGAYYYFPTGYFERGISCVTNTDAYYVSRVNDTGITVGKYDFDGEGKLIIPKPAEKNGLVEENNSLYYYKEGVKFHAGLIYVDGAYYYIKSSGEAVRNCTYYVSNGNNLLPSAYYAFDENGKMVRDGLVTSPDGTITYYKDGAKYHAGLIKVDGAYYYIKSNCTAVKNCDYYVSNTNGLVAKGTYHFGADGKMEYDDPANKNGLISENGKLVYYVNGVKTHAGLIEADGFYYYIKSNCTAVTDCDYYVSNPNGLMSKGWYHFDSDGRMVR